VPAFGIYAPLSSFMEVLTFSYLLVKMSQRNREKMKESEGSKDGGEMMMFERLLDSAAADREKNKGGERILVKESFN
jgi:hypothetical protein